jgi:hypothetical protein
MIGCLVGGLVGFSQFPNFQKKKNQKSAFLFIYVEPCANLSDHAHAFISAHSVISNTINLTAEISMSSSRPCTQFRQQSPMLQAPYNPYCAIRCDRGSCCGITASYSVKL